jgi:hypothetical protein
MYMGALLGWLTSEALVDPACMQVQQVHACHL